MSAARRAIGVGAQLKMHPPAEQWSIVRRLEALGYDSVVSGDHLAFHHPLYESMTLLASYAAITTRLRLGVSVYLLALRQAAVAAKVAATLDVLSGGRLIFGVGVGGEYPKEFSLAGVPTTERGARVSEGIEVVRALWRDGPTTFRGRFSAFEDVSIDPKPVQRPGPPIWVGGRSPAALARAGRQGDGWISYVVQPERFAQSLEAVRAAAAAAGRSLEGFTAAHVAFVTVGRDFESARDTWVRILSTRYAQDFGPLVGKYGIVGTPAQCAEQLDRFRRAGCGYFVVDSAVERDAEGDHLEQIGRDLLPLL